MAIVFAIACALLSRWQFARNDEARIEVEHIEANYDADPVAIASVLPALDAWSEGVKWTPVSLRGTYLVDEQLLVRNRPYNGSPGFEVLTPLRLDDGDVFVVDRGWVPSGNAQDAPDAVPAPPGGEVTVVARLKQGEPELAGRTAPAGQIPTIELDDIATALGRDTYTGAYGLLDSEDPAPATRPLPAPEPALDEGPHLSYAIQWIVFALFGFFGLGYALRTEYRARRADAADPDAPPAAPRRPRRPPRTGRDRSDAEIEDELLDAR
ncbi:SURF1 family protein [Galbitalea sp. SE-J8]|uniref:SURF1 family cytochrome oxidase biogenesis protein n=1 Tax=Galbitalea sp. SE-J8 TaxID=3054952 RepID=UPI00259CC4FE|nr:SURF1 family protein [Galbitalea sp. SE-J8]MDM4763134.1 SURF1 family protein [Galbitalea sp. SE-J8]